MELDWFTLIAQVINFLVLVALLRYFLYDRIVEAMNEREAKIASRLDDAARVRATAEQEAASLRARNQELDDRREELFAQVEQEAEVHRQELLDAAQQETESAREQWFESLQRERQELLGDLRERLGQQVIACTRQAVKELANKELDQQILERFVERLRSLDPSERETIIAKIRGSNRVVEIRTAFPVAPEARERLTQTLREPLDDVLDVQFVIDPKLIGGVELRAQSHRLFWNLDSYLDGLEAHVFEILDDRASRQAQPQ